MYKKKCHRKTENYLKLQWTICHVPYLERFWNQFLAHPSFPKRYFTTTSTNCSKERLSNIRKKKLYIYLAGGQLRKARWIDRSLIKDHHTKKQRMMRRMKIHACDIRSLMHITSHCSRQVIQGPSCMLTNSWIRNLRRERHVTCNELY